MSGQRDQTRIIRKIQRACNLKFNEQLCYNISQFYSETHKREINRYSLTKQITDGTTGKHSKKELFGTYSLIQMVFFIRDYWYRLNGMTLPDDNKKWSDIRKETVLVNDDYWKKE